MAGLAVAVVTVVRDDGPADVRVADDTSTSTSPTSSGTSAPPGDGEPRLRIATVRVGRHDGYDRVVVEFTMNLPDDEVTEVDDIATEAGFGPAFAVDDVPNNGECDPADLAVEGAAAHRRRLGHRVGHGEGDGDDPVGGDPARRIAGPGRRAGLGP